MIVGIILASGFSRRMGEDKLLLRIDGKSVIEQVIKNCKGSSLAEIILVYRRDEVKAFADKYKIRTIYNGNASLGLSESVKLGLRAAPDARGYMLVLGDQPFVNSILIDKLIGEFKASKLPIVVPFYHGEKGTPSIFSSSLKKELLRVEGDKGGRDIIRENMDKVHKVYIDNPRLGLDIDTREDLNKI